MRLFTQRRKAMSKPMTASILNMYMGLLEDEFKPLMDLVNSKKAAYTMETKQSVITEWKLAEKVTRKAMLETELKMLSKELESYLDGSYKDGLISKEVKRRVDMREEFKYFDDFLSIFKKKILLSDAPADIREVFAELGVELQNLTAQASLLPGNTELLKLEEVNDER